ncbi:DegT/DnrJ/EryC1/StrS family aminotransferase [Pedobacter panaciterrae]
MPSEITAAFLYAQLENLDEIQSKRKYLWNLYYEYLEEVQVKGLLKLPIVPLYATNNAHMFYVVCKDFEERNALIEHLSKDQVHAVFHYISLHTSPYYAHKHDGRILNNADYYTERLVRLPLFYELDEKQIYHITESIKAFYRND